MEYSPVFTRRHWRFLFLAIALSVGALVLFHVLTAGNLVGFLARLSSSYLAAAFGLVPLLWLVEGWRVQLIVRIGGEWLGFWPVWQANLATAFMAAITPAGAGGPPTQVFLLHHLGVSVARAASVAVARLFLNLGFFAVVSPPLFYWYREGLNLPGPLGGLVLGVAFGLSGLIFAFFYLLYRSDLGERLLSAIARHLPAAWSARLPEGAAAWRERLDAFRSSLAALFLAGWRPLLLLIGLTALYWLGFFSLAFLLIRSLGVEVTYGTTLVRQLLYYFLVSYVPLPGAGGVAELGLALLLAPLVPRPFLPGVVAAWRFLTYYLNILVGGPFLWLLLRQPAYRTAEEH